MDLRHLQSSWIARPLRTATDGQLLHRHANHDLRLRSVRLIGRATRLLAARPIADRSARRLRHHDLVDRPGRNLTGVRSGEPGGQLWALVT